MSKLPWNRIFKYNKDGSLTRLDPVKRWGFKTGRKNSNGYLQVGHEGVYFMVHRIVWEMHNGPIKKGMHVNHKNFNREDNRIENLELVKMEINSGRRTNTNPQ